MEKDVVNQPGPDGAWKVLSPIAGFWLAFVVATGGLAIRLGLMADALVKDFLAWCLQAGVIFPISALISSFLVRLLYERTFGYAKPGKLKWLGFSMLAYILTSVLAVLLYLMIFEPMSHLLVLKNYVGIYFLFVTTAPWEFGVYIILFFCLNLLGWLGSMRTSLPNKLNVRSLALPVMAMALMAGIALNVKIRTKQGIQNEFVSEIERAGEYLPMTDNISVGNAIKAHEKKYGLKVTGEASDDLLQKLREEPTKLAFTVGDKGADYDDLGRMCAVLSNYNWREIRKQMKLPESELIRFEIKIKSSYTVSEPESCSVDKNFKFTISSLEEGAPATIHFRKTGRLDLSSDESYGLEVKGLKFEGDGGNQMLEIKNNVVFKENTVVMPKEAKWFGLHIAPSNEKVRIEGNQFTHAAVLIGGSAGVVGNRFSGDFSYLAVKEDGAPEIGANYFEEVVTALVSAADKSRPKITGKLYLSTPSKFPLMTATDHAVVEFKDGSIAGPQAAGCLFAEKSAKLVVNNVSIGPCGENYWPVYLADKATAEIRGSVFSTKRGEMKDQFNKPLEDAVLVLDKNKVAE